ncbi:MAG: alpha/beta fold hydrolase [Phycisphaerales bacterium]|nr:alpha/beta fold hydrolase [Phycisphaerales bacterium]
MTTASAGPGRSLRRAWRAARQHILLSYLALLLLSHLVIAIWNPDFWVGYRLPAETAVEVVHVPMMLDDGPAPNARDVKLALWHWPPDPKSEFYRPDAPPVLLLHGSPAQGARDYRRFGPRLAKLGRDVYAIDRPGFGNSSHWVERYSVKANARYALAAMDALGIDRVHAVGWSQSGGVVLWMAELEPQRIASLTMLGAIGIQEGEGSGSYRFEHVKYALGYVAAVVLPELVPHFNLIGDRAVRHAFIRDFWDTDQRPLRGIMERLQTPTLILQGRHDPLVSAWVAEEHHRIIKPSRLVMLDASHFFVFGEPMDDAYDMAVALQTLAMFTFRHDPPGVPVRRGEVDFAPAHEQAPTLGGHRIDRTTPWFLIVLFIVLGTFVSEDLTVIAVGLLVVVGRMDWGVALLGCALGIALGDYGLWAIGRFGGRRILRIPGVQRMVSEQSLEHWSRVLDRHTAKAVFLSRCLPGTRAPMYIAAGMLAKRSRPFLMWVTVAVVIWTPILLIATMIVGPRLLGVFREVFHGPWVYIAAFAVLFILLRIASLEATKLGRQRLKAEAKYFISPEFWPMWLFYVPLVPWMAWLSLRYRGVLVFTCANPGFPEGGGVIGEQKSRILAGFSANQRDVLPVVRLDPGDPETRVAALDRAMTDASCGIDGYPVVLKPEEGQRGFAVRIIEDRAEAIAYFNEMPAPAIAQVYHPGPAEFGVMWARNTTEPGPIDDAPGFVFSVTRKTFPVIRGDGKSTIEELIWHHKRYRMQAKRFLKRLSNRRDEVLDEGRTLQIAMAGNHCQGTMFTDGADLITPELSRWMEQLAQSYREPGTGKRFDYGRIDVRCASEEAFRRAEGLGVVEINGTSSESTNLYDPNKSIFWMYGVLFRQWRVAYAIGARRRAEGAAPMTITELWRSIRRHRQARRGPAIAD